MIIGYPRVSTTDQRLDVQVDALNKAGCHRIFTDHACAGRGDRLGLTDALSRLCAGDTLMVWKLNRLVPNSASDVHVPRLPAHAAR